MVDDELATLLNTLTLPTSPIQSIPVYYGAGPEDPQRSSYPFIIYGRVFADSEESIGGESVFTLARYSFDVAATARRTARVIADALIALLQGHSGTEIKAISHGGDSDLYDPETSTHHIVADFDISY